MRCLLATFGAVAVTALVVERPFAAILPHAQGAFGADLSEAGVTGVRLLAASPNNACSPLRNSRQLKDKVALITRGGCNFTTKVLHAQKVGAVGAVVTDTENTERWAILMSGGADAESRAITVPSVFVSLPSGKVLWDSVATDETHVTLNSTGQVVIRGKVGPLETLAIYLVVSLILLAFSGFCGLFLALGVQRWQRQFRSRALRSLKTYRFQTGGECSSCSSSSDVDSMRAGSLAATTSAVAAVSDGRGAGAGESSGDDASAKDGARRATHTMCAICLDDYEDGELLMEMPLCKHAFHEHCVKPWLQRSAQCAMCKSDALGSRAGQFAAPPGLEAAFDELSAFCRDSLRLVVVVVASVLAGAVMLAAAAVFQRSV